MKQYEIKVHKRQYYQQNATYYGTFQNWQNGIEFEHISADYFIVTDVQGIEFYIETGNKLVAAYHSSEWLSVRELIEEDQTDVTT